MVKFCEELTFRLHTSTVSSSVCTGSLIKMCRILYVCLILGVFERLNMFMFFKTNDFLHLYYMLTDVKAFGCSHTNR